jgi:hypothetical protein
MRRLAIGCALTFAFISGGAFAQDDESYASWPVLRSTFPSTSGGGWMIKGYDPVIVGDKCITTFLAVAPAAEGGAVYPAVIEFTAVPAQGGTLCHDGKWRSFNGKDTGGTPFRVFFKDGIFRGHPLPAEQG